MRRMIRLLGLVVATAALLAMSGTAVWAQPELEEQIGSSSISLGRDQKLMLQDGSSLESRNRGYLSYVSMNDVIVRTFRAPEIVRDASNTVWVVPQNGERFRAGTYKSIETSRQIGDQPLAPRTRTYPTPSATNTLECEDGKSYEVSTGNGGTCNFTKSTDADGNQKNVNVYCTDDKGNTARAACSQPGDAGGCGDSSGTGSCKKPGN